MRSLIAALLFLIGCAEPTPVYRSISNILGQDSFALAARYGTPGSYQHQGNYFQLNYGSESAGCHVIVLLDQTQRVAGWASSGVRCDGALQNGLAKPDLNVLD
jgi:hypothetical protein